MLLAFDIGNTNVVVGCFQGDELKAEFRLKTDTGRTVDEYASTLVTLMERNFGKDFVVSTAIISSVVPPLTPDFSRMVKQLFSIDALVVGPGIKTGIAIKISEPTSVGADRIVNSVAVRELYGTPALVVDLGTATSFDYVNSHGEYEGGIIAPGVKTSLEALVSKTAKLPRVELVWPKTVVGKGTVPAMQSGAVIGYQCLVDGLIGRIIDEVGPIPHIIATGGLGRLFSENSKIVKKYDPHLNLQGLRLIARMNSADEK